MSDPVSLILITSLVGSPPAKSEIVMPTITYCCATPPQPRADGVRKASRFLCTYSLESRVTCQDLGTTYNRKHKIGILHVHLLSLAIGSRAIPTPLSKAEMNAWIFNFLSSFRSSLKKLIEG